MKSTRWSSSFLSAVMLLLSPLHGHAAEQAQAVIPAAPLNTDAENEYGILETDLSCEEATGVAQRALERLDYTMTSVTPATAEKAGLLTATRTFTWGDQDPVSVKITCGQKGVDLDARPDILPCEQANRIARLAIEHLGYAVTEFTPAANGKPGLVRGAKKGQPEVYIALGCEGRMVTMDVSSDSPLLKNRDFYTALRDFRRGFFATYKGQRGVIVPLASPPSTNQVQVVMRPLSRADSKLALGAEITKFFAVQVQLTNPTKRSYQLETDKISLVSLVGDRVKPLPEQKDGLPTQGLANQVIQPGATVTGYLYYPLGTYRGARGFLVEAKSQEREGFEVPF
ncbi:MAG: hypothetical protein HYZ50_06365 [Deltaproteobacteria bacterium]|nr:hypothetical protein [Deltaproteobacteria bacterium]